MRNIRLSVVVPSYNETIKVKKDAIDSIDSYMRKQRYSYEVVIVDDKSTNGSVDFVREYVKSKKNFRLMENSHGGKAITVMTGMLESVGEIALFTDMDQATPIDQVEKLLPKFDEGFNIAIGSRKDRKGAPLSRKLAAFGFITLRNLILGLPFLDTQCGFKAFDREAVEMIFPPLLIHWQKMKSKNAAVNAGFDSETLFIARKRGLRVAEVGVIWRHVANERQVQLIRDSIEAIRDMIRIRINDLKNAYR